MNGQEKIVLLDQLRRDARVIAEHFQLQYRDIVAEHPRVKSRYGVCYADGLIKIRLTHARTGKPLKYSSLVDTLCHELAHLRHFNHGPEFKSCFLRLLSWARRQGIYQPRPARQSSRRPHALGQTQRMGPVSQLEPPRRNGVAVFPKTDTAELTSQRWKDSRDAGSGSLGGWRTECTTKESSVEGRPLTPTPGDLEAVLAPEPAPKGNKGPNHPPEQLLLFSGY